MAPQLTANAWREQLGALCPTVDNLRRMLGTARHAFNRHSTEDFAELVRLLDAVSLALDPVFEKTEKALQNPGAADRPYWGRLHEVITHLELMGAAIVALENPIREKIKDNIIFSDKDFIHINQVFTHHTGLLRALADIFTTDNASLKDYVLQESEALITGGFAAVAAHESHTLESLGQPKAWSIYLSLLDHSRIIVRHLMDVVKAVG